MRLELKAPYLELFVLLARRPRPKLEVAINALILQVQDERPGVRFALAYVHPQRSLFRTVTLFGQKARRVL